MKRWIIPALLSLGLLTLAACSSGPGKRVSDPAASIQQLTVNADGSWSVDLRLQNYSSIPMHYESASLALTVGDVAAGTLAATPGISIGPESADVITVRHVPSSAARIVIADSLSAGRGLSYSLEGTIDATPEDKKLRTFDVKRSSALSPVPGLPGTLR